MNSDDHTPWWYPVVATLVVLVLSPVCEGLGERIAVALFGEEASDDEPEDAIKIMTAIATMERDD